MDLTTIYDTSLETLERMTRVQAIIEIQRLTSNVTEETFKSGNYDNTVGLALLLQDKLMATLKPLVKDIVVKIDVVDIQRLIVKVDAGKTGKVTLKVKRQPGGVWSRNFD